MDEQAEEIMADYADYMANPGAYTLQDFEDIFQDRDPFEFIQNGPSGGRSFWECQWVMSYYSYEESENTPENPEHRIHCGYA